MKHLRAHFIQVVHLSFIKLGFLFLRTIHSKCNIRFLRGRGLLTKMLTVDVGTWELMLVLSASVNTAECVCLTCIKFVLLTTNSKNLILTSVLLKAWLRNRFLKAYSRSSELLLVCFLEGLIPRRRGSYLWKARFSYLLSNPPSRRYGDLWSFHDISTSPHFVERLMLLAYKKVLPAKFANPTDLPPIFTFRTPF